MDSDGEIKLTTAPRWAHPDGINRQVHIFLLVTRGSFECFCYHFPVSSSGTVLYFKAMLQEMAEDHLREELKNFLVFINFKCV